MAPIKAIEQRDPTLRPKGADIPISILE